MSATRRKQALGKGLGALLSERGKTPAETALLANPPAEESLPPTVGELRELSVDDLEPNPHQPRRKFRDEQLAELAQSIREHGVLQPILASAKEDGDGWYLLAGERRWRASKLAGKETIPARIITASEVEQLELALIENVQREDLNAVEEALAYQQLAERFGYSQDQIAQRVGKSRVAVANALRLLRLNESILHAIESGSITAGHARALLMLPHPLQQESLRQEIEASSLSVREAERRAKEILEGKGSPEAKSNNGNAQKKSPSRKDDLDVVTLEEKLTLHLGCKVRLKPRRNNSGSLEIQYHSLDDLDRVLEIMGYDAEH